MYKSSLKLQVHVSEVNDEKPEVSVNTGLKLRPHQTVTIDNTFIGGHFLRRWAFTVLFCRNVFRKIISKIVLVFNFENLFEKLMFSKFLFT